MLPDGAIPFSKINGIAAALAVVDATVATKADQAAVGTALALKHTTGEALVFTSGGVQHRISTEGGSFSIQRLVGNSYSSLLSVLFNSALGTARIAIPGELRPASIAGPNTLDVSGSLSAGSCAVSAVLSAGSLSAPNIYSKTEVDALVSSSAPSIADDSLAIGKTAGLQDALLTKATTASLTS